VENAGFEAIKAHDDDKAVRLLENIPDIRILFIDTDMPRSMGDMRLSAAVWIVGGRSRSACGSAASSSRSPKTSTR